MIQNMLKTMKNAKFAKIMKIMKNMPSGISDNGRSQHHLIKDGA